MVYKYAPKAEETKDVEFKDVTNDKWYYESVMYMAENGYINGYPDGTFKPDANISRAEICTILFQHLWRSDRDDRSVFSAMYRKISGSMML